jgi:hypothetical protein
MIQERLDELDDVFRKNREEARKRLNRKIREAMNGDGWGLTITDESLIDDDLIDEWHQNSRNPEVRQEEYRQRNRHL